ncbi:hypothetical protein [Streptomyces hydrogenans]|uniref:hypothetical protein n=1 Tax=Streptomyces hydrogenans TaxID=1873719 RepID=UPI0038124F8F
MAPVLRQEAYGEAEPAFARALVDRAGLPPPDDLRPALQAAMLNAALRAAVEHHAWHPEGGAVDADASGRGLARVMREVLRVAAGGLA